MNIIEFIKVVLVQEFGDITDRHKYLSFGIISQGIELLGACLDEHEFDIDGHSKERFNLALKELFPEKYHEFGEGANPEKSLYKNIRCGLLHSIMPKINFALTEVKGNPREHHLKIFTLSDGSERYLLVAEEFYEDFKCACYRLIDMIEDGSIFEMEKIKVCESNSTEDEGKKKKIEIIRLKREFLRTDL